MDLKKKAIYAVLILLIGFGVYANSLNNRFVWDDNWLVVNNPDIKTISAENIKTVFTHDIAYFMEKSNFYRPLQTLSYMIDYRFWGDNPVGFRLTNIAIHSVNAVLIFFLLYFLFRDLTAGFLAAVFFLVHPLNTSAVAYIAGRADLLALLFLLASFAFLVKFKRSQNISSAFGAIAAFVLSLLTKEACVVFPLFACMFLLFKENETGASSGKNTGLSAAFVVVGVLYIISRLTVLKFAPLASQAVNIPEPSRRLLALAPVVVTYLRMMILPYDLRMDRDFIMPQSVFDVRVIVSLLILGAICFGLGKAVKKEKKLTLGAGWFLILLFPYLNIIIPVNAPLSEHWLYIPFFGVLVILAYCILLLKKTPAPKEVFYSIIILALAVYAGITMGMNRNWQDEESLFKHISKYRAVHPRVHYNLGREYLKKERYADAVGEFQKSVKANPDHFETLISMAAAYAGLKDFQNAFDSFQKAVQLKPDAVNAYLLFAQVLSKSGNFDGAISVYQSALRRDDKNAAAYNGLGIAYAQKGLYEKAKEAWQKTLELEPGAEEARKNLERVQKIMQEEPVQQYIELGNRYASQGDYGKAITEFEKAVKADDKNVSLHNNLGVLYGLVGRDEDSIAEFKRALQLDPAAPGAYKNLGIVYSRYPEKRTEAINCFEKYLELNPSGPDSEKIKEKIEELRSAE